MSAAQDIWNWPDTIIGTTLKARNFVVTVNSAAPGATLTTCTAIFKKDGVVTITAPVTITSASLWHITVGPVTPANITAAGLGAHTWELHTVDSNGVAEAYVAGTLPIIEHV